MCYQILMKVSGVVEESWSATTKDDEGNLWILMEQMERNLKGTFRVRMSIVMVKQEKVLTFELVVATLFKFRKQITYFIKDG